MNDKITNTDRDEEIAGKLTRVAEQTHANAQFASDLEQKLRNAHQPRSGWFMAFNQISPALRWVALMILLAVVLSWSIKTVIPAPQPAVDGTPVNPDLSTVTPAPDALPDSTATPMTQQAGYEFRGAKLFLQQPLPESPDAAHVYLMNREEIPATREQALALAERFGIQGQLYTTSGLIYGTNDYLISDGKQSIQVHSTRYFSYTSDMAKSRRGYPPPDNPDAEVIIRDFLTARGFDFPFRVYASISGNGYAVQPLAPDALPIQYESYSQPIMRVVLDENGDVLIVDATLMEYDQAPLGEYGIITADEALRRLLDDGILTGKTELVHSASNLPDEWYRDHPDNQPVNLYGYLTIDSAVDPNTPSLLLINGIPLTGNTNELENLQDYTFVKATGQFIVENGIRKFNIESWDRKIQEEYLTGVLTRQGDQIIFTSNRGDGAQYPLNDAPADVPLDADQPGSQLAISGVIADGKIDWTYIQYFETNQGGGGGGGGGLGFHELNLSGTPVPFASPTPRSESALPTGIYSVQEGDTLNAIAQRFGTTVDILMQLNGLTDANIFVGQKLVVPMPEPTEHEVEDLLGYLSISIRNKSDGTSIREYALEVAQENGASIYTLEGSMLSELDEYNALPVIITGTVTLEGKLIVDHYEIPYPDVQFQILKGTQREEQLDGQTVIVFTTEAGQSYVEYLATNTFPTGTFTGNIEDLIQQEVLILPGETFGGLPVAHIYQSSIVQDGGPEMQVQANGIYSYDEADIPGLENYTPPNLIIENVELVYFVSNPYYQINEPSSSQRSPHIQPVWHFQGRFDDGTEFDMLVQAIKEEFLLPDLAPGSMPG